MRARAVASKSSCRQCVGQTRRKRAEARAIRYRKSGLPDLRNRRVNKSGLPDLRQSMSQQVGFTRLVAIAAPLGHQRPPIGGSLSSQARDSLLRGEANGGFTAVNLRA